MPAAPRSSPKAHNAGRPQVAQSICARLDRPDGDPSAFAGVLRGAGCFMAAPFQPPHEACSKRAGRRPDDAVVDWTERPPHPAPRGCCSFFCGGCRTASDASKCGRLRLKRRLCDQRCARCGFVGPLFGGACASALGRPPFPCPAPGPDVRERVPNALHLGAGPGERGGVCPARSQAALKRGPTPRA